MIYGMKNHRGRLSCGLLMLMIGTLALGCDEPPEERGSPSPVPRTGEMVLQPYDHACYTSWDAKASALATGPAQVLAAVSDTPMYAWFDADYRATREYHYVTDLSPTWDGLVDGYMDRSWWNGTQIYGSGDLTMVQDHDGCIWAVWGPIRDHWLWTGGLAGPYGAPTTDVTRGYGGWAGAQRTERFAFFQRGVFKFAASTYDGHNPDGLLEGSWARDLSGGTRYNDVRQKSSHNSFDDSGQKRDLYSQLEDQGVRSLEFDIHHQDDGWAVYHAIHDSNQHCTTLRECLGDVAQWHYENPGHDPITIWLDLKDDFDAAHDPLYLDEVLGDELGAYNIYQPVDLKTGWTGSCYAATNYWYTLQDAARSFDPDCGWPRLDDMKGMFVVVLNGGGDAVDHYVDGTFWYPGSYASRTNPGNAMAFVAKEVRTKHDYLRWDHAHVVFFNVQRNDKFWYAYTLWHDNLVTRMYECDSCTTAVFGGGMNELSRWNNGVYGFANHLVTDNVDDYWVSGGPGGAEMGLFSPEIVEESVDDGWNWWW